MVTNKPSKMMMDSTKYIDLYTISPILKSKTSSTAPRICLLETIVFINFDNAVIFLITLFLQSLTLESTPLTKSNLIIKQISILKTQKCVKIQELFRPPN